MMDLALLLSLVFVFMSSYADAEDICGIPIIKPIFNYTLNGDILSDVMQDGEAEPHSFPWMARLLQPRVYPIYNLISNIYILCYLPSCTLVFMLTLNFGAAVLS